MYMVEITEDKIHSMAEHVEQGLKHMGKLMQCLEDLEEDFSSSGAYGERGRLGRNSEESDWWDEEDKRNRNRDKYTSKGRRY